MTPTTGAVECPNPSALQALEASNRVDLLVSGSRGYGPLRAVLVGTVSQAMILKAHCPVMVVPRGAENALEAVSRAREAAAG